MNLVPAQLHFKGELSVYITVNLFSAKDSVCIFVTQLQTVILSLFERLKSHQSIPVGVLPYQEVGKNLGRCMIKLFREGRGSGWGGGSSERCL